MSSQEILRKDEAMTGALKIDTDIISAPTPAALTLYDRCDRCGAEALTRIIMPIPSKKKVFDKNSYDLVLCGHHTNEMELGLTAAGGVLFRKPVKEFDRAKD